MCEYTVPTMSAQIIEPILDYLTANLQTLGDYLLTPVLHGLVELKCNAYSFVICTILSINRILHLLWGLIVGTVQGKLDIIPRKSSSAAEVYRQLEFVLQELKCFFNCDGNGVPSEDLNTEACKVW